jgi:hypothetical protein
MNAHAMNRRNLLIGIAAASTATVPIAVEAAPTPQECIALAVAEIKAAASELWPDIDCWRQYYGDAGDACEGLPIFLSGFRPAEPKHENWTGPGWYEVQHGKARPIYYIERTATGTYRACHWWKGKRQGGWKRFTDATLKIIRKVES